MRKHFSLTVVVALLFATVGTASYASPAAPLARRTNAPAPAPAPAAAAPVPAVTPRLQVFFSPGGGCTEAIVDALGKAKTSIDVQAYSFTSAPIAEAVGKAFARGVKVRVVLDKSQRSERYTSATYLANHNVPTWIDTKHAIAHNKIILVDGKTIFTGSFNFTKAAEQKNAENLLIIEGDPKLFAAYLSNFEEHLSHSEKYEGLAKSTSTGAKTADEGGDAAAADDAPKAASPTPVNKPAAKRSRKAA
jgi:phosphatidylserine/phosphatidylglycerophosphate/cardiolipin synthase-like enzyme